MKKLKLGASELELLTHIASEGGMTVGQVAEHFEQERGWVRSTVQRMMDRLLGKGLLTRKDEKGVFKYRSTLKPNQLQTALVREFVSETLGGSLRPFVSYLSGGAAISDEDLRDLKAMVESLEKTKRKK